MFLSFIGNDGKCFVCEAQRGHYITLAQYIYHTNNIPRQNLFYLDKSVRSNNSRPKLELSIIDDQINPVNKAALQDWTIHQT